MKKETFINLIDGLEKQSKFDFEASEHFEKVFEDFIGFYNNNFILYSVMEALKSEMEDENEWIDYFIYELNYGKAWNKESCIDENGEVIDISTSEKLYDFLKGKSNDN